MSLTSAQRKALKQRAHHLKPVIRLGQKGLTDAVVTETDQALAHHELIKVHIAHDDRHTRAALAEQLAQACDADLVSQIGKVSILYRAHEDRPA
ncbi:MAG: ribosome assembly RNA-binding protein YhbY [Zetaproteobacteria bacterium]|nr:MAG: ribosome assembly RNA-binding protein YhbY [Zetaproteobacteria bacterium]